MNIQENKFIKRYLSTISFCYELEQCSYKIGITILMYKKESREQRECSMYILKSHDWFFCGAYFQPDLFQFEAFFFFCFSWFVTKNRQCVYFQFNVWFSYTAALIIFVFGIIHISMDDKESVGLYIYVGVHNDNGREKRIKYTN